MYLGHDEHSVHNIHDVQKSIKWSISQWAREPESSLGRSKDILEKSIQLMAFGCFMSLERL